VRRGVVIAWIIPFHEANEVTACKAGKLPSRLIRDDGSHANNEQEREQLECPVLCSVTSVLAERDEHDESENRAIEQRAQNDQGRLRVFWSQKRGN